MMRPPAPLCEHLSSAVQPGQNVLADKAYDADWFHEMIWEQGAIDVIPSQSNRKSPKDFDADLSKQCNKIERFFSRLRASFRRIATRDEKTSRNFLAMIRLASIQLWPEFSESAARDARTAPPGNGEAVMQAYWPRRAVLAAVLALAACGSAQYDARDPSSLYPNETPELRFMIEETAARHDVPVALVQRVVLRESTHRPQARNGPYYGLMQILPQTAGTMGYRGQPEGLLDPETNLEYGVRYLRGAYLVAGGNHDRAVQWYARGYYYEAKRLGMLEETGLR